jgi:aminopeptidase N
MTAQAVYLKDYRPPGWKIPDIELRFELGLKETLVHARLHMERINVEPLILDGDESLELLELCCNGQKLGEEAFRLEEGKLHLLSPPEKCVLEIKTRLRPQENTALEGLYASNGRLLTQCEAQGFRRITFSLDRPDVLSRFKVTLLADASPFPVLLSNGNLVEQGRLGKQHWAVWEDPFPKPTYLFALVAGDLALMEDVFVTRSGRRVALRFFSEPKDVGRLSHAVEALKRALRWDEERFGLEYDLEQYTVVAVSDFNMGAMENKGLNIFNTQCVLADKHVATDADFREVESVIAHECFHNWTGNRVTLRDWFQLSLKEGLTIFRDQEFSATMHSKTEQRIGDVYCLKAAQFAEDASPLSHPVRPESYFEINNFYTTTVYQKGAELVRMLETLLGKEKFDEALKLYLQRHDGQAATCEDFLAAMEEVKGEKLSQFMNWYTQRGTPTVFVEERFDAKEETLTLTFEQRMPFEEEGEEAKPLHIPLRMALLDAQGEALPLRLNAKAHAPTERVLELKEKKQRFCFSGISRRPVLSALRGLSAPVFLKVRGEGESEDEDLARLSFLAQNDSDEFNRWDAAERLGTAAVLAEVRGALSAKLLEAVRSVFENALTSEVLDLTMRQALVCLPSESTLSTVVCPIDAPAIHRARESVRTKLAHMLLPLWAKNVEAFSSKEPYQFSGAHVARRGFYYTCLSYAVWGEHPEAKAWTWEKFRGADNLTDALAALWLIEESRWEGREEALEVFLEHNQGEDLVVDKWFALQATSRREDTFERVRQLALHPAFRMHNPNRVRALLGAFSHQNPGCFHMPDGKAYAFLTDRILELDAKNPQMSSRLASALSRWRQHVSPQKEAMHAQLERLAQAPKLSPDLSEVVSRSLKGG